MKTEYEARNCPLEFPRAFSNSALNCRPIAFVVSACTGPSWVKQLIQSQRWVLRLDQRPREVFKKDSWNMDISKHQLNNLTRYRYQWTQLIGRYSMECMNSSSWILFYSWWVCLSMELRLETLRWFSKFVLPCKRKRVCVLDWISQKEIKVKLEMFNCNSCVHRCGLRWNVALLMAGWTLIPESAEPWNYPWAWQGRTFERSSAWQVKSGYDNWFKKHMHNI